MISTGSAKILATDTRCTDQMLWIAGRLYVVTTEQFFRKKATAMFSYAALSDMTAYKVPKADFLAFAG